MFLAEFFNPPVLNEGGNMFPDSADIPREAAASVLANLKRALPKELSNKVFATGSAGFKPVSGDMDVMIDNAAVAAWSKQTDPKAAKAALKSALEKAGLEVKLSGVSVHARVPMGKQFAQVDIMLVDDAAVVSTYHQHDYSAMGTTYKGKHKHILLSSAAKAVKSKKYPNGLMWSAFQGLFSRGPDGKKADLITRDPDTIAKTLLNPNATAKDLASPQSIVDAIPANERAAKLASAKDDFDKEGIPLPESTDMKIAEAAGQLKGTDVAKTVKPQPFAGSQPHPFQGMLVGDETGADENPTDKITMDVPLFVRMLEYAREDAKTDMDLHNVTERAIELMQAHDWLCMDNYDELVGSVAEGYTGRETKDGTWRVFKDGQSVAVAGPFKSRDEAHAWIKKQKQGVAEAKKKPKPTSPEKWAQAKAKARSKFEVYPSAYANAWAAKEYKRMGGGWRMG